MTLALWHGLFGSQSQAKAHELCRVNSKSLVQIGMDWTFQFIMSGRTDTGVHAMGQVVSFDLGLVPPLTRMVRALNATLPADVAVQKARIVNARFHPRFDATSRRYQYKLFCQPVREPIRESFAWRVWPAIDGDGLCNTAQLFIGRHDFSAFGSPTTPNGSTVRTVIKRMTQAKR